MAARRSLSRCLHSRFGPHASVHRSSSSTYRNPAAIVISWVIESNHIVAAINGRRASTSYWQGVKEKKKATCSIPAPRRRDCQNWLVAVPFPRLARKRRSGGRRSKLLCWPARGNLRLVVVLAGTVSAGCRASSFAGGMLMVVRARGHRWASPIYPRGPFRMRGRCRTAETDRRLTGAEKASARRRQDGRPSFLFGRP